MFCLYWRLTCLFLCCRQEEKGLAMAKSDSNLQIPLTNGNVIKIPLSSINITEEMNKTSIWRQLDSGSTQTQQQQPLTTLIQTPQGSIR